MKNLKKTSLILTIFVAILISFLGVYLTDFSNKYYEAHEVYRVYLEGKSIGLINSKKDLEKLIDKEQEKIKLQYNAYKVYIPKGLEIQKETTYSNNIKNKRKLLIYNKIEIHKGINPSKNVCRKNTISTPLVSPPVLQSLDASVRRQGTVPSFLETDTLRASVSLDRPCLSLPSVSLQSITGSPSKRKPAFNGTFSYFDLERRDWRCFRVDTLVGLDRDYVV